MVRPFLTLKTKVMEKMNWYLGVDVSKSTLDITLLSGHAKTDYRQVLNTTEDIRAYFQLIKIEFGCRLKECLICMEYTGIYNNHILQVAHKMGISIWLESAVQIKQSTGVSRIKNDKVDSEKIALYAYRFHDIARLWQPPREAVELLNQLSKQREKLIKIKHHLEVGHGEAALFIDKKLVKAIKDAVSRPLKEVIVAIKVLDKKIEELIEKDEHIKSLADIITSVPGVGKVTAVKIIITTNEFKDITDPRKYACYGGIAPFERTSGTSIRGKSRVSKKANLSVKTILSLCARSSIVHDPDIKQYYQRKVAEGKNKQSVLNAVRNKIIHRVFACVNNNRRYEKIYQHILA